MKPTNPIVAGVAFLLLLHCSAGSAPAAGIDMQADSLRKDIPRAAEPPDSAHDTLASRKDSVSQGVDSLERMTTPALVGTIDRWLDSSAYVTSGDIHWIDFTYLGSILQTFPGSSIRDQSSPGQYNQISFGGIDWRSIAVIQNGRTLSDPSTGVYNLYDFSPEYADRIEVVSGPRAFLYGFNSTGATVNLLTKNYNSNRPFTKIDYSEGPYNYAFSDGTFSQNLSRKINVTLGYQHQGIDGRFTNSYDDAWNARAKIRYNPSPAVNIIASEYFTSTYTDMNGGVDILSSGVPRAFDPLLATVMSTSSYEKLTRHDVDLSLVGTFLGDTADVTMFSLYYSHALREYRNDRPNPLNIYMQADHVSSWMGASFTQNVEAPFTRLTLGANAELRQIEGSPNLGRRRNLIAGAYGKDDLLLGRLLTVSAYGRLDSYLGFGYVGLGSDASVSLDSSVVLFGGGSLSHRMPNYMELGWSDSTVARPSPIVAERHLYVETGVRLAWGAGSRIQLGYFHRTVTDPVQFTPYGVHRVFPGVTISNGPALSINGIETKFGIRIWKLFFEGNAMYLEQRSNGIVLDDYPHLAASGGIYFWGKLLRGNLELKTGFRGQFRTRYEGDVFNPELPAYVTNTSTRLGVASSVDFFLIARIGDAYIHFMWENLTDIQYFTTPFSVANDRGIRFGIAWEFLN